jgi:hypothetical protein
VTRREQPVKTAEELRKEARVARKEALKAKISEVVRKDIAALRLVQSSSKPTAKK